MRDGCSAEGSALHQHNRTSTGPMKLTQWSAPSLDKPHKWKLTLSLRAHLLQDTMRKPWVSAENATLLIWIRSFTFCQMLLGKSNLQEGRSEIWAKFYISLIQWRLGNGLCVCASGHAWESNIFFWFQKGFQFSRVGTELPGCAGISKRALSGMTCVCVCVCLTWLNVRANSRTTGTRQTRSPCGFPERSIVSCQL